MDFSVVVALRLSCSETHGTLVPRAEIKPKPPALQVCSQPLVHQGSLMASLLNTNGYAAGLLKSKNEKYAKCRVYSKGSGPSPGVVTQSALAGGVALTHTVPTPRAEPPACA